MTARRPHRTRMPTLVTVGIIVYSRHYRSSLMAAIQGQEGLMAADLGDGSEESLRRLAVVKPHALLVNLPPRRLVALLRAAHARRVSLPIVAVNCDETEEELLPLFEAGISGFVPHEAGQAEMLATIRAALRGEVNCPPQIVGTLLRRMRAGEEPGGGRAIARGLTPREAQVARNLEQGLTNKEIAVRLGIEPSTAKNHVHSILHKLSAHRRGDAVRRLCGEEPDLRIVHGRRPNRGRKRGS